MRHLIVLLLLLLLIMALLCAGCICAAHFDAVHGGGQFTSVSIPTLLEFPKEYTYTDTETGAERTHRSLSQFYAPPESNRQIQAVVQHGSIEDYGRLLTLLHKFWRGSHEELLALTRRSDSDAYATIARHWRGLPNRSSEAAQRVYSTKASTIYASIKRHAHSPKTLLDIGCGAGYVTAALGRLLNAEAHGADFQAANDSGIQYKQLGDSTRLPYDDASMDIIIVNMVLHHVEDIRAMVHEFGRILTPDGVLYIADHDCWDAVDAMLVDIEHQLYHHTWDRKNNEAQAERAFKIHRYSNYYGWDEHFKGTLECIDADFIYPQLKNSMGASRQFWGVYAKPGVRKTRWSKS